MSVNNALLERTPRTIGKFFLCDRFTKGLRGNLEFVLVNHIAWTVRSKYIDHNAMSFQDVLQRVHLGDVFLR